MKSYVRAVVAATLLVLSAGCASMQQLQSGMDEIDSFWGETNAKILAERGMRVYSAEQTRCWDAAKKTANQMGFTITEEIANSGLLTAKASAPLPFTDAEFKDIKKIEEPMMQAVAANHVGGFTSSFFILEPKHNDVIVKVHVTPEGSNSTRVQLTFQLDYKGPNIGVIVGHNPPPEAVRKGLDKWWSAYEKNLGA